MQAPRPNLCFSLRDAQEYYTHCIWRTILPGRSLAAPVQRWTRDRPENQLRKKQLTNRSRARNLLKNQ
jgi:hypothetical protein